MTTLVPATPTASIAGKYLTFVLNQESYGVPVLKVREIMRLTTITPVPQVPSHVKGVINLRGRIVPVIDLCAKLGLRHANLAGNACIVVVQVNGLENRPVLLGLMVDAVEEVGHFTSENIEPAPEFCTAVDTAGILGLAKTPGGVKTLLNIDQILGGAEVAAVRSMLVQT